MAVFVAGLFATYYMFTIVPGGFVPAEDQGIVIGIVQAPDGVSRQLYRRGPGRGNHRPGRGAGKFESYFVASGAGLEGRSPNQGLFFAKLKHWDERPGKDQSITAVLRRPESAVRRKSAGQHCGL